MDFRPLSIVYEEPEHNIVEQDSSDRVLFYEEVPPLQDIIAFRIAVALWYNIILDEGDLDRVCNLVYNDWHLWQGKVSQRLKSLSLSSILQNKIGKKFDFIGYKLREFETYHYSKVPAGNSWNTFSLIKNCRWHINDIIDYRETALQMLSNPELSEEEKFQIKCKYGLVDEILKTSLRSLPKSFIHRINFKTDRIIYYWICHLKNKLHKIPVKYSISLDGMMFSLHSNYIWPAIEYFWDGMDVYEQILKAIELLIQDDGDKLQLKILSRMNEYQQRRLFSEIPVDIMRNFYRHEPQSHHAYAVWNRMKHLITGAQFAELISCIDFNSDTEYIWETAPDALKTYVVNFKTNLIVDKYLKCSHLLEMYNESTFLLVFLSFVNENCRKSIIQQNRYDLVIKNKPTMVEQILTLSFQNENEIADFKDSVMKSYIVKLHCYKLLNLGYFENFAIFLQTYSTEKHPIILYKIQLLETWELEKYDLRYTLDKWNELVELIDEAFSGPRDHAASVTKLKKRVIQKFSDYGHRIWSHCSIRGKMETTIMQLLSTDELAEFRKKILHNFRIYILEDGNNWFEFDENYFNQLILWCLQNEDSVMQFKKSLPVDEIFKKMWIDKKFVIYHGGKNSESEIHDPSLVLSSIEKFLHWYFENTDDVKRYKLDKLDKFRVIKTMIRMSCDDNVRCDRINTILLWFLDGDKEEIEKFQFKYNYYQFPK